MTPSPSTILIGDSEHQDSIPMKFDGDDSSADDGVVASSHKPSSSLNGDNAANKSPQRSADILFSETGWDDAEPPLDMPIQDVFISKMFVLLTRKAVPHDLFKNVVKVINEGISSGVLDCNHRALPTSRDSAFNMLQKHFPCPKHKTVPLTLELHSNKHKTVNLATSLSDKTVVQRFPFKDTLLHFLWDKHLFGDIDNLNVNPNDPFGIL